MLVSPSSPLIDRWARKAIPRERGVLNHVSSVGFCEMKID